MTDKENEEKDTKSMDKDTPIEKQEDEQVNNNSTEEKNEPITIDELISLENVEDIDENNLSLEILKKQLNQAEKKAEENWDNLLRKQAEYDNLQKRVNRDLENTRLYALEKFVSELLAIKDSMELGLEASSKEETEIATIQDGMTLTLKMLNDVLQKFNILEISPQDQKFDPQWHEAIATQPVPDVEDGTVIYIHQKGYQLNDRLLRPARVVVAKALVK
ncbi:MAG: nucleotide exchange factor GrpE [Thiomargarita sp.]|nr:nucleotide exchange factor GrpE [Thiomargarita sp.]